jgi:hypothetical protein
MTMVAKFWRAGWENSKKKVYLWTWKCLGSVSHCFRHVKNGSHINLEFSFSLCLIIILGSCSTVYFRNKGTVSMSLFIDLFPWLPSLWIFLNSPSVQKLISVCSGLDGSGVLFVSVFMKCHLSHCSLHLRPCPVPCPPIPPHLSPSPFTLLTGRLYDTALTLWGALHLEGSAFLAL